jgi:hypothetical protein
MLRPKALAFLYASDREAENAPFQPEIIRAEFAKSGLDAEEVSRMTRVDNRGTSWEPSFPGALFAHEDRETSDEELDADAVEPWVPSHRRLEDEDDGDGVADPPAYISPTCEL